VLSVVAPVDPFAGSAGVATMGGAASSLPAARGAPWARTEGSGSVFRLGVVVEVRFGPPGSGDVSAATASSICCWSRSRVWPSSSRTLSSDAEIAASTCLAWSGCRWLSRSWARSRPALTTCAASIDSARSAKKTLVIAHAGSPGCAVPPLAAAPLTNGQTLDAGERAGQLAAARGVLDRLRDAEPDGRVVLELPPSATALPADLVLENNDRIVIPARATTVGVFGAVYRPASFLFNEARPPRVRDYIERAGGPLRAADKGGIFVIRANGSVLSKRNGALSARVLPGDVIFVPVKTQSTSIWARIREITTIVSQIGFTAAALSVLNNN